MKKTEYTILDVHDYPGGLEAAARYIHSKWGRPQNYPFYLDAITHSGKGLPQFFLLLDGSTILGCGALLTNDFVSRHDLWPWYGCHYIEPEHRGNGLGKLLLEHGIQLAKTLGYGYVYLSTDHDGYYEKYDWERIEDGFDPSGERTRIYRHDTGLEK